MIGVSVSMGTLLLLTAVGLGWLVCHGLRLWDRLRLRHIPQVPFAPRNFLVGHLSDFSAAPPYVSYERWGRRLGGIFLIFLGRVPTVVLRDPELIRQVCVGKFKAFHDRPGFVNLPKSRSKRLRAIQSGLLVAKGGYWASLRAAMQPLFHTSALHSYGPIMDQAADKLAGRLRVAGEGGEGVEVHSLLGGMTMSVIGQSAFGIDFSLEGAEEDRAAGIPNVGAAVQSIFRNNFLFRAGGVGGTLLRLLPTWLEPVAFYLFFVMLGNTGKTLEYARTTLMATADLLMSNSLARAEREGQKVTARRTDWQWWSHDSRFVTHNPYQGVMPASNSVIDMLLRATNKETGEGLSDMQVAAQCNTLIAAGYETSANSLSFTLYLLAAHPEAQARLAEEVDSFGRDRMPSCEELASFPYAEAVIQESMRLYPPAFLTTRMANEDAVVGGHLIPRGTQVHIDIYGLHHNPALWDEPERFRPERFLSKAEAAGRHPNAFMPFGMGPRMCIGWRFAMQEMQLTLVRLLREFSFELAPGHEQQPLQLRAGITLAPANGVWLQVRQRS